MKHKSMLHRVMYKIGQKYGRNLNYVYSYEALEHFTGGRAIGLERLSFLDGFASVR